MTSSSNAVRLLTVEDRFEIKGLGVILAPDVDHLLVDLFVGASHIAEAVRPDGTRVQVEIRVVWERLQRAIREEYDPAVSCVVIATSATKAELPIGTALWCERPPGEPSSTNGTLDELDRG